MSYATVHSCTLAGVNAVPIIVEVHISGGLPSVSLVGLPQSAVRESKDRVRAAIQNAGFEFPQVRVTVNLAPADLPKQGGRFDLPIALGIMMARGYVPENSLDNLCVVGELGLNGELRAVTGVLPSALSLRSTDKSLLCPADNLTEAMRSKRTHIIGARTLNDVVHGLKHRSGKRGAKTPSTFSEQPLSVRAVRWASIDARDQKSNANANATATATSRDGNSTADFSDVHGHTVVKRGLEIAAAGGHNVLLVGSPGTGKSMLATRFVTLLPPMNEEESLESASVASVRYGDFETHQFGVRPFRSPHHTITSAALIGGGYKAQPGEISLAHQGVLFLDEMAEFSRPVLDALREPMETGCIHLSRLGRRATYPAQFQLIGACNPCPCGYFGDAYQECQCSVNQLHSYQSRLSGPLLDRIDLHITVARTAPDVLLNPTPSESSEVIRQRVVNCHALQLARQGHVNQRLSVKELEKHGFQNNEVKQLLNSAGAKLNLSHRAIHRTVRVARTIADLAGSKAVELPHVAEAMMYRSNSSRQ